jgi:hypothetical protein
MVLLPEVIFQKHCRGILGGSKINEKIERTRNVNMPIIICIPDVVFTLYRTKAHDAIQAIFPSTVLANFLLLIQWIFCPENNKMTCEKILYINIKVYESKKLLKM